MNKNVKNNNLKYASKKETHHLVFHVNFFINFISNNSILSNAQNRIRDNKTRISYPSS